MLKQQEAIGRSLGPIIEMRDGATWLFKVVDVRATTGEYEGWLIDGISPGEEAFSINAHMILRDKVNQYFQGEQMWFQVARSGLVGRAMNYTVHMIQGSDQEILNDSDAQQLLRDTSAEIANLIREIPSADSTGNIFSN